MGDGLLVDEGFGAALARALQNSKTDQELDKSMRQAQDGSGK
jgi:Ni,Fe-hydrogenase maturation factor